MEVKFCVACKEDKPITEFYLKKNGRYHSWCNDCRKRKKKEWDTANSKHIAEYREINKEHIQKQNTEYRELHYEKLKERWTEDNKRLKEKRKKDRLKPEKREKEKARGKKWRTENRERYNQYFHNYHEKDPIKKIVRNMRHKAYKILKGNVSPIHSKDMFGCELGFFKKYIESQFTEGMNWENYGFGKDKWNVDHTPPLASYDYSNPDNFKIAFHWSHCSPKWLLDNIAKNSWHNGVRHYYK